MANINWPSSPVLNQVYTSSNGASWRWDGEAWVALGTSVAPSTSVTYDKQLISGGAVWTSGMNFDVSLLTYNFYGPVQTTLAPLTVTLAVGGSQDRIDAIVVDDTDPNGNVLVIQGDESSTPSTPSIPSDKLLVQFVLVPAGVTSLNVLTEAIYQENTEWTTSTFNYSVPIGSINFNGVSPAPFAGSKCVSATVNNRVAAKFTKGSTIPISSYDFLAMRVQFTSPLPSYRRLYVRFMSGSTFKGNGVYLNNTFCGGSLSGWQTVIVPLNFFSGLSGNIDGIEIRLLGGSLGEQKSFALDSIVLQAGYAPLVASPTITVQNNGTSIGTRPKINFVPGSGISFSITDSSASDRVNVLISSASSSGIVYTTYSALNTLKSSSSLSPGTWYSYNWSIPNPFTVYYEVILFATSTNTFATEGYRVMRVPKTNFYTSTYFTPEDSFSIGERAGFGNIVYQCIQAGTSYPDIDPPCRLNPSHWTEVSYTNNSYYETKVYEISFDWNNQIILHQKDEKLNTVTRATMAGIPWAGGSSSIDLHEWNNPSIKRNYTTGVWNNWDPSSNSTTSLACVVENNNMTTSQGQGYIQGNRATTINGNSAQYISNNLVNLEIQRNDISLVMTANSASYISDNTLQSVIGNVLTGGGIYSNTGSGSVTSNTINGGIEFNRIAVELSNNIVGDGTGISSNQSDGIFNNTVSGNIVGNTCNVITDNSVTFGDINYNDVYSITSNYNFGIERNQGRFQIANNTNNGAVSNNTCQNLLPGISSNSNSGSIIYNQVVEGIYNNSSATDEISYNIAKVIRDN
jgi:hypothetical protein